MRSRMTTPLVIRFGFWVWLLAAIAVGRFNLLQRIPLPAVQGILLGLTALLVLSYRSVSSFRTWVGCLDLRSLVLLLFFAAPRIGCSGGFGLLPLPYLPLSLLPTFLVPLIIASHIAIFVRV